MRVLRWFVAGLLTAVFLAGAALAWIIRAVEQAEG